MKTKLKVTTALLTSLFLVSIIAVSTPAIAAKPDGRLMINIMAKGDDMDVGLDLGIYRATTLIVGKIRFDEDSGVLQGRVEFHMKIYEISSGEKVYAIKGKLKESMMVLPGQEFNCTVRNVLWTNLWLVVGFGMIKTTGTPLEIVHRGISIILPNTGGKWMPKGVVMMVSPYGEYEGGVWEDGGWAFAGEMNMVEFIPIFGGVTYLTNYMEKFVP